MPTPRILSWAAFDKKEFRTDAICAGAGCHAATLRAWRNQNGLMPHTEQPPNLAGRRYRWTDYSLLDICVARLVVLLTEHGLRAQEAVDFADNDGRAYLRGILGRALKSSTIGFSRTKERGYKRFPMVGEAALGKTLAKVADSPLTVLDLQAAIDHVLRALNLRIADRRQS
jgi:hypothetical protein